MSQLVQTRRDGEVAVIIVDNPPVNALKYEVRAGILEGVTKASTDAGVAAIVIASAGRTFIAGADITEFGKPPKAPSLIDVIAAIDEVKKPVIAAMHGTPLGGGLEITLACHFRVAAPDTRLGLPEIKLGLIPGAGGTQRLPRLVGVEKALDMILSGNPIPAKDALSVGLIDEIVEGDLIAGAVAFARKVVAEKRPLKRVRDMEEKVLAPFRSNPEKFAEAAANLGKRARGLDAPTAAIEAVRWTLDVPIDAALKQERDTFIRLMLGDQSKAQRHLFFAEREASKIPGLAADIKPREIKKAAVIGAGTMGGGISMNFANAGIPVTVVETTEEALQRGFDTISKNYRTSVQRGGLSQENMDKRLSLFARSTSLEAVADADIIIEAVFEEMDIKKKVFTELDRLAKPGAVLATNTSYLDVNAIAQTNEAAAGSARHALLQSRERDEVARDRARKGRPRPTCSRPRWQSAVRSERCLSSSGCATASWATACCRQRRPAERLLLEGALRRTSRAAASEFGFPMGPLAMETSPSLG